METFALSDNHSIAYCLLGYLCAYYRCYHPIEFITSFLNNAANDADIKNGTAYANSIGIKITMPKWGISRGEYFFDRDRNIIAKGLSSVKFMGDKVADELYELSQNEGKEVEYFMDLLMLIGEKTSLNSKQLDILIKLDFFSDFGNQRVLLRAAEMFYGILKRGEVCQIAKIKIQGTSFEKIVQKYSTGVTKAGTPAKSYTVLDVRSIMIEEEQELKNMDIPDIDLSVKARNFKDAMGYYGYMSGEEKDRPKLQVTKTHPIYKRKDHSQCGYRVGTISLGSGIESVFTIFNSVYNRCPIEEGDIILCRGYTKERGYFTMTRYDKLA